MRTTVHLLRHGEVHNPTGVLYGRQGGYHLSALGQRMAQRVADTVGDRDIVAMWSSPLERAQETGAPLAAARGLELQIDERIIESSNVFEGQRFGAGVGTLKHPKAWRHLWNPFRPSWGEPYVDMVSRMRDAINDARDEVEGHEAVLVSHQLPIWITRLYAEGRSFVHDPRRRQCTLCSLTSLTFEGRTLVTVTYSEPAGDLIPVKDRGSPFSAGGADEAAEASPPDVTHR